MPDINVVIEQQQTINATVDAENNINVTVELYGDAGGSSEAVLYTAQSLTDSQEKRARDNIISQSRNSFTVGIENTGADYPYQASGTPIHYAEAVESAMTQGNVSLNAETVSFITKSGNAGRIDPISDRTIRGAGIDETIINSSRPDYVVRYTSTSSVLNNFSMSDFTLNCQNILNTSGLEFRNYNNIVLEKIKLLNSSQWLLKLTNEPAQTSALINKYAKLQDLDFAGHDGIYEMFLLFNSDYTDIYRCKFHDKTGSPGESPTMGIWQKANFVNFEDCEFKDLVSDAIYYSFSTNYINISRSRFENTGRAIKGCNVSDYGKYGTKSAQGLHISRCDFFGGANSLESTAIQIGAVNNWSITDRTYIEGYKRGVLIGYGNDIPTAVDGTVTLTINGSGVITGATLSGSEAIYNPALTYQVEVFLNNVEVTDVDLRLVINPDGTAQSTINVVDGISASNLTGATARNRNGGDARYPSSYGVIDGLHFYNINPDSADTSTFSCIDFGNGGNHNAVINFSVDNSTGSLTHAVTFNGKTLANLTVNAGAVTGGTITETEAWYDQTINFDQNTGVITRGGTGQYTCAVTGGGGTGAVVRLLIDADGRAYGLNIVSGGTGYTSAPTITCPGGYHGQLQFNNCDFDGLGVRRNDNCVVDWETIQFNNCIDLDSTSFPTDFARNASIKSTRTIALRQGLLAVGRAFANIVNDAIFQIGESGTAFNMRFGSFRQRHSNSNMEWIFANFTNLFWRVYKDTITPANLKMELDIDSGSLRLSGGLRTVVPTYADNAAALSGGLVVGDLYKTATGELRIVV